MTKKKKSKSNAKITAPVRAIVRFINKHKGRFGNPVRVAVLECKHRRATDMAPRKSVRCYACLREKRATKAAMKKAA